MNQRFDAAIQHLEKFFGQVIEVNRIGLADVEVGNYHVGLDSNGEWCVWELSEDFTRLGEYDDPVEAPVEAVCHALSLAAADALEEMMLGVGA